MVDIETEYQWVDKHQVVKERKGYLQLGNSKICTYLAFIKEYKVIVFIHN